MKAKIRLFFAKNGKWIYAVLAVICLGLIAFLCNKFIITENVSNWVGENIAVIGTLLGAVIGGVFTLLGSVYVNKKQLKAQTHIKRKNLIYKPLYDELCSIENDILFNDPYPSRISFKIEEYGVLRYPQYTVWDRIKSDTRYLETPKGLASELEKLYSKINTYLEYRDGTHSEMTDFTNGIFQEVIGTQSTITNLGYCVIGYALEDSQEDIYEYCKFGLKDKVDVSEEQRRKINELFYERSRNCETILKIKKAKQEWNLQQKKVINLLTDMIKYVNIKYEG